MLKTDKRKEYERLYSINNIERRREYWKKYYIKNREKLIKIRRKYFLENPEICRKRTRNWQKNNKEKIKEYYKKSKDSGKRNSYEKVSIAIKDGTLIKPKKCSLDNSECQGRIEAHHEDYKKPLEVIWLCEKHHKDKHNKLKINILKFNN